MREKIHKGVLQICQQTANFYVDTVRIKGLMAKTSVSPQFLRGFLLNTFL